MEMAGWANLNLTTINNPISEIIDASIDRVTVLIKDPDGSPLAQLFDCALVERGTLRPLLEV
jgi:DNA-binding LacI/PurR family transcriptional regulator